MLWQCQLQRALEKLGFQPDLQDPAVYVHPNGMMLVTHVDDFLIAGEQTQVNDMMTELGKEFKMTVNDALDGKEHTFLGRSLRWVKPGHMVFGVGQRYIEEAFTELKLKKDPTAKKIPAWTKQPAEQVPLDGELQSRYRSITGEMVWLDRADIRPAVIRLGSQLGKATERDMKNAERVWSYLWQTREKHR